MARTARTNKKAKVAQSTRATAQTSLSVTPGITVRYSTTVPEEHPLIYAYALKVEVTEATGYPDHIFVFNRAADTTEGDWVDEFIQIASPLEIEEVPENAPDLDNNMPYYRAKEVTIWFRTMEDLNLAKTKIKDDIRTLTETYDVLNNAYDKQEEERYE